MGALRWYLFLHAHTHTHTNIRTHTFSLFASPTLSLLFFPFLVRDGLHHASAPKRHTSSHAVLHRILFRSFRNSFLCSFLLFGAQFGIVFLCAPYASSALSRARSRKNICVSGFFHSVRNVRSPAGIQSPVTSITYVLHFRFMFRPSLSLKTEPHTCLQAVTHKHTTKA